LIRRLSSEAFLPGIGFGIGIAIDVVLRLLIAERAGHPTREGKYAAR
jgi:hypothetical protein